jgi:hypothetical protein
MQGEEPGDDEEVVFFSGGSAQRTTEDPVTLRIRLGGPPGELMNPGMRIQA